MAIVIIAACVAVIVLVGTAKKLRPLAFMAAGVLGANMALLLGVVDLPSPQNVAMAYAVAYLVGAFLLFGLALGLIGGWIVWSVSKRYAGAVAVALLLPLAIPAVWTFLQEAGRPPPATISGRVLQIGTGEPVEAARVILKTSGATQHAVTNGDGLYELPTRYPSAAWMWVEADGYYRPPRRRLAPASGDVFRDIDFQLEKGGTIAGRVVRANGSAATRVTVMLLQLEGDQGQRRLRQHHTALTDADGRFRFGGFTELPFSGFSEYVSRALDAGEYFLVVATESKTFFYPGTTDPAEARPIRLTAGEDVGTADIGLPSVRTGGVSGVMLGSDGLPFGDAAVYVIPTNELAALSWGARSGTYPQADGTFEFLDLTPGEYIVWGRSSQSLTVPAAATAQLASVSAGEVSRVELVTRPSARLRGKVRFSDATTLIPDPGRVLVRAGRPYGVPKWRYPPWIGAEQVVTARPAADGSFEVVDVTDLLSGPVVFSVRDVEGWGLQSVVINGRNVTNTPTDFLQRAEEVELTLARMGRVEGQVAGWEASGAETLVIVFADHPSPWDIHALDPERPSVWWAYLEGGGLFTFDGLLPGNYLAAVSPVPKNWWIPACCAGPSEEAKPEPPFDLSPPTFVDPPVPGPSFFELLRAHATPFRIEEGATTAIELQTHSELPIDGPDDEL